ncbi:MAG: ATP-binding protein [Eggerthellaceae bacterium]|nr:ATP-binding protein [Eggerthellaceae bacterium]
MADLELQSFIEATCTDSHLRVEEDLGDGFVRLRTDEAQRRQAAQDIRCTEDIVIELLRNSRDAHARSIYVASSKESGIRTLTVIDDGEGIPSHMHELIFEPRVTSKLETMITDSWGVHGRGMALYSVKTNAKEAYVTHSSPGLGCAMVVKSDTSKLTEKTDQSTFPKFLHTEQQTISLRGPKNIIRTMCEFAIEQKSKVQLFFGSPGEIASTLYWGGQSFVQSSQAIFSTDENDLSVTLLLSSTDDPREFAEVACSLGLELSERTARRILGGKIKPVEPLLLKIAHALEEGDETERGLRAKNAKGERESLKRKASDIPHIAPKDISKIVANTSNAFSEIAEKYYLDGEVKISTQQRNGKLSIDIPLQLLE